MHFRKRVSDLEQHIVAVRNPAQAQSHLGSHQGAGVIHAALQVAGQGALVRQPVGV